MQSERLRRSRAQEKRGAKLIGGRRQPASGAYSTAPNDVRSDRFLIEYKRTDGTKSITLKVVDLRDAESHALGMSKMPAFGFEVNGEHWYALPEWVFEELLNP